MLFIDFFMREYPGISMQDLGLGRLTAVDAQLLMKATDARKMRMEAESKRR